MTCTRASQSSPTSAPYARPLRLATPLTLGVLLALGSLSGCALPQNYSDDTCDGKAPVETMQEAGEALVQAAYSNDLAGVCRVISPFAGGELTDDMVTQTKEEIMAHGITPENVTVVVGEQMGSGVDVRLTDGTQEHEGLSLGGRVIRDRGFTIGLPGGVYPTDNSTPGSATEIP